MVPPIMQFKIVRMSEQPITNLTGEFSIYLHMFHVSLLLSGMLAFHMLI